MVRGDDDAINGPDDLAGKTVCSVERLHAGGEHPRRTTPTPKLEPADAYSDCLEPLRNKQVDAVTTDNVILAGYVAQNEDDFKLVGEPFTEEPYGIGLKKGDDEFRDWINDVLEESFTDGAWDKAWEETAGEVLATPEPPAVDRY